MLNYKLHTSAISDINHSIDYYEEERQGLGAEFYDEFLATLNFLRRFPFAGAQYLNEIRRFSIARFHYTVFYELKTGEIHVLGVIHQRRHPDSWEGRQV